MRSTRSRLLLAICCIALAAWTAVLAQSGHRITARSMEVNTATHWRNWDLPDHAVDITADGAVRPHYFRDRYNILDDMESFTRPIVDLRRRRSQSEIGRAHV